MPIGVYPGYGRACGRYKTHLRYLSSPASLTTATVSRPQLAERGVSVGRCNIFSPRYPSVGQLNTCLLGAIKLVVAKPEVVCLNERAHGWW